MLGNTYAKGRSPWNKGKKLNPNRLPVKEYLRNYCLSPNGIYAHIKNSARRRKISVEISKNDFVIWYEAVDKKCHYCDRTVEEVRNDNRECYN
jgi:hypothetical protein